MLFCPLVQIYNKLIKVINALISTALIYVCTYTMFQILIFFFFCELMTGLWEYKSRDRQQPESPWPKPLKPRRAKLFSSPRCACVTMTFCLLVNKNNAFPSEMLELIFFSPQRLLCCFLSLELKAEQSRVHRTKLVLNEGALCTSCRQMPPSVYLDKK